MSWRKGVDDPLSVAGRVRAVLRLQDGPVTVSFVVKQIASQSSGVIDAVREKALRNSVKVALHDMVVNRKEAVRVERGSYALKREEGQ